MASLDSVPPKTRRNILRTALIMADAPKDTIRYYENLYIALTGDSSIWETAKKNESSLVYDKQKDDLQLSDLSGQKIRFDDLLKQLQGKVVYIDFWASWCAPCRQGLPDAKRLRQEYSGKDVAFVYLSTDKNGPAWEKAVKEERIDRLEYNYRVLNQNAETLRLLEVNQIPRFMIFDKAGKLVEPNAPRPGTEEIRDLFHRYLDCLDQRTEK